MTFLELSWGASVLPTGSFVGVVDMGRVSRPAQRAMNVRVNDDTGVDWAMYVATVADAAGEPDARRCLSTAAAA